MPLAMRVADGFARQRLVVVDRRTVAAADADVGLSPLHVTDVGWFAEAANHYRERPVGATEAILIVCTEGSGWCDVNGGTRVDVAAGDVLFIPRGSPHRYGADAVAPWTIWWLHLAGTAAAMLFERAARGDGVRVTHPRDIQRVVQLVDEVLRAMERGPSPENLRAAAGCAWHVLGTLAVAGTLARPDPVERVLAMMADRLDARISVDEFAAEVSMSPSHLSALFRRATGSSLLRHFTAEKMAVARELLESGYAVHDVARRVGYDDSFYFSRQFRQFHGISPSRFAAERGPSSSP